MNESNKGNQSKEHAPQSVEAAKAASPSTWKKLMAKKWAFPAIYVAAAALILTLVWVYQGSGTTTLTDKEVGLDVGKAGQDPNGGALPAGTAAETLKWPVSDESAKETALPFYDSNASADAKQAALIEWQDKTTPHLGVDFARADDQSFDVVAALSGKVSRVEQHPLIGNAVEITHANGLVTIYQSLSDIKVQQGDEVKQGDAIAKAGRNELEQDEGNHVHFEVRRNGEAVNPETLMNDKQSKQSQ